jgi:putative nucleotidyltransferase with HDIG domain
MTPHTRACLLGGQGPVRLYVGGVCAVGLIVIAHAAWQLPDAAYPVGWSMFALLALVAGRYALKFPGVDAHISMSDTFFITSVVLFGPAPATVVMAADSIFIAWRRGWRTRQVLFNGASPAISLWTGSQTFFSLTGSGPLFGATMSVDRVVVALACFALVYFVLNVGLTAVAVAIEKRMSPAAVWRRHFMMVALNHFAAASAAFLLLLVVQYVSVIALVALAPLFALFHVAMNSWTGRLEDAERHIATVDRLYLSTIEALSTAIEAKDGVTSSHIHRVQHYAMGLARALGSIDAMTMKAIQAAALLHDTGKLGVPERILNKPGKLTAAEYETMKRHVDVGADILSSIDFPYPVVPIVRAHHENWDGSGYPRGLRHEEIPIGARILSVVDCYDALTSDRPYRSAMSDEDALTIIRSHRGSMYDPAVVDVFERVCRDIAPGSVQPELRQALKQISLASEPTPAPTTVTSAPVTEGHETLLALVNLARIVHDGPTAADVASVAWSHMRHLAPGASCGFFLTDSSTDSVVARFVAGPASQVLQGLRMKIGERLTGWVAGNAQPIMNSEATLDLGQVAALANLDWCMAVPLMDHGQVIGVLSLYSPVVFRQEQAQTLEQVAPHLAQMFAAVSVPQPQAQTRPTLVRSRSPGVRAAG